MILAFATGARADQLITIAPGSQISLSPNVSTTIICTGNGGGGLQLQKYCTCEAGSNGSWPYAILQHIIRPTGAETSSYLTNLQFNTLQLCSQAMVSTYAGLCGG